MRWGPRGHSLEDLQGANRINCNSIFLTMYLIKNNTGSVVYEFYWCEHTLRLIAILPLSTSTAPSRPRGKFLYNCAITRNHWGNTRKFRVDVPGFPIRFGCGCLTVPCALSTVVCDVIWVSFFCCCFCLKCLFTIVTRSLHWICASGLINSVASA